MFKHLVYKISVVTNLPLGPGAGGSEVFSIRMSPALCKTTERFSVILTDILVSSRVVLTSSPEVK